MENYEVFKMYFMLMNIVNFVVPLSKVNVTSLTLNHFKQSNIIVKLI